MARALDAAAALLLLGTLWVLWQARRADLALPRLAELPPDPSPPPLTVVVPCRNEAGGVEAAIRSLLAQDLPGLEVVAVDDRSEDATGAILDRLAAGDPRLQVVHVASLPAGWLGKNHAMHLGGGRARGDWLLFTDGDVVFGPGALARALGFARARGLGHVAAAPRFLAGGLLERAFVTGFAVFGALGFRVHELRRPGTAGHIGVGAFNLVRRADWLRVGGHERLRLEVVDDVKLGLVLRRSGVPQGAVLAGPLVAVRWQAGFLPSVLGLVKNAFAATGYRPLVAVAAAVAVLLAGLAPALLLALSLAGGAPLAAGLAGAALALWSLLHGAVARQTAAGSGVEGLLFPPMATALAAVLLWSGLLAAWRG
ncbi:MAG: glycosyltransferase, partial [Anaeromyxobacteraceae bacterium]|nr:glycosyltransferase [Anaeromyxobacteraceae bacterium]